MVRKSLGECYLLINLKNYYGDGSKKHDDLEKKIKLTEEEAQLLFETIQNGREEQIDEDIEEIFS
ncbi:hypothetical protein [Pseudalkalibacillus caeni]|uniref:Uncharacterized protein n=1 Tax=Exobacillus caeni TaxID=2574798 RepID=A0A5R9F2T5_9BACL|nr:hypothetical protein [Pseudalkalibacillus caeni]TLS35858.1 hypothetical protein FCL54_17830 [Pseudalkalibacillus caeni]